MLEEESVTVKKTLTLKMDLLHSRRVSVTLRKVPCHTLGRTDS